MGGGTHEATISMECWEHERLNRPDGEEKHSIQELLCGRHYRLGYDHGV